MKRLPWSCLLLTISFLALPGLVQSGFAQEEFRVTAANTRALLEAISQVRELRAGGELSPAVILLPSGRYELLEPLRLTPAEVGNGLAIKAETAGEVVLSGSRSLGAPRRDPEGNWRYRLPENWEQFGLPRVIMIDNQLRGAARYPATGYLRIERALADRRSGFVVEAGDLPAGLDLSTGHCDLVLLHDWSSSRLPVARFDATTRELKTVGPIGCEAPHYAIDHFEKQPRYWLEGHPSFARQPGDWHVDRVKGEVVLRAEPDAEVAPEVFCPWSMELLVAEGSVEAPVRQLALEGITFTGSRFAMPPGGLAGAQATMHEPRDAAGLRLTRHRPMLDAAVRVEHAEGCRFTNCQFVETGNSGLWLAGNTRNCVIRRCRFRNLGGNGLNLGEDNSRQVAGRPWYLAAPEQVPTNNRVEQCEISYCGTLLPGAVGLWAPFNRGLQILDNHIHDCPYSGISLGWMWNPSETPARENLIRGNRIEFVMQVLSDGGGIYTLGNQPDSLIENNFISDIPLNAGRAESNGMFLDEGTTGFTIRGNTIRRIDRSPLRFHKAGNNLVQGNAWELATETTPPVRFNNTPVANISIADNSLLEKQRRILLIGNSLTWDTIPSRLDEAVHWHVDCGKPLTYLFEHPQQPCVGSSRLWPAAMRTAQYDVVSVQPHYGTTLEQDVEVISRWVEMQPTALFVIHTGWAKHETLAEEAADSDPAGPLTHSDAYFEALLQRLREKYPERTFRSSGAMNLLFRIREDIAAGRAPLRNIEEMYRDAIHMQIGPGRYLMHNRMRQVLGQPRIETDFPEFDPALKRYLDELLDRVD